MIRYIYRYIIFISWKLMFSVIYSTRAQQILNVLLMKGKPNCRKKFIEYYWVDSCLWRNRWTLTALHNNVSINSYYRPFQKWTDSCYQLDILVLINPSHSRWISDQNSVVLLTLGSDICQKNKKTWNHNLLELASDKTIQRSKPPLIRL